MINTEKRALQFIDRHSTCIAAILLLAVSMLLRLSLFRFSSGDMKAFISWSNAISDGGGFPVIGTQVGDYNGAYIFLLFLGTLLPLDSICWIKGIDCLFDYVLALGIFFVLKEKINSTPLILLICSIFLLLPTVFLESACWGQCDSIYASFIIWSLYFALKEKYALGLLFVGISLAFKLQAVFIIPFYIYLYFRTSKFSIANLIWVMIGFYIPMIPSLLAGRSILDPIKTYILQANEYGEDMTKMMPNIWNILNGPATDLKAAAILLTCAILLIGFVFAFRKKKSVDIDCTIGLATWTIWTCVEFLPCIHGRYDYVAIVLLFIYLALTQRPMILVVFLVVSVCNWLMAAGYLFFVEYDMLASSLAYFGAYVLFSYQLLFRGSSRTKIAAA